MGCISHGLGLRHSGRTGNAEMLPRGGEGSVRPLWKCSKDRLCSTRGRPCSTVDTCAQLSGGRCPCLLTSRRSGALACMTPNPRPYPAASKLHF